MNSSQHKKNHEEHNWINTLAEPTDLAELTDLHMKNKGDYLQSWASMSIDAWQDQGRSIESFPTSAKTEQQLQNKN